MRDIISRLTYSFLYFRLWYFFQAKGVRIVTIGIGEYEKFEGQLEEIAGENVYSATTFNQLSDMFAEILNETCSKSPTHTVYPPSKFWVDYSSYEILKMKVVPTCFMVQKPDLSDGLSPTLGYTRR